MGRDTPRLSVVYPAYNEARSIRKTLEAAYAYLDGLGLEYEIIVAADGDDGTREIAAALDGERHRMNVIGEPRRRGKGRGVREGMQLARGDIVGFIDADDKTPITELSKFLPLLDEGWDVVIGSRATSGAHIERRQPLYRVVGSRVFGLAMHLATGLWQIHDTQCGFKFFRGPVAKDLFARQTVDGYMFDVEILCLAAKSGYRVKEVGVKWADDGDSRLDLVAGNWRNGIDLLRIAWRTSGR